MRHCQTIHSIASQTADRKGYTLNTSGNPKPLDEPLPFEPQIHPKNFQPSHEGLPDSTGAFFAELCLSAAARSESFTLYSSFPFLLAVAGTLAQQPATSSHASLLQRAFVVWHHGIAENVDLARFSANCLGFEIGSGGDLLRASWLTCVQFLGTILHHVTATEESELKSSPSSSSLPTVWIDFHAENYPPSWSELFTCHMKGLLLGRALHWRIPLAPGGQTSEFSIGFIVQYLLLGPECNWDSYALKIKLAIWDWLFNCRVNWEQLR